MELIKTTHKRLLGIFTLVLLIGESLTSMAADKKATVQITYNGNKVEVVNKAKQVKIKTDGAYVSVENALTGEEVEFVLSGKSDNGSFNYNGAYKTTVTLNGVSLKSQKGCAINLKGGKRMKLQIANGTTNSLEDSADTLHKACVYTSGHLEISGSGTLNLNGHGNNVISAKEYIQIGKNTGKIAILADAGNAINTGARLTINGGDIEINSSAVDKKALKADSLMTINGGTINAKLTGDGGQGIKCMNDLVINGGTVNIATSGNYIREAAFGGPGGFGGPMGGFGEDGEEGDEDGEGGPGMGGFGGPGMGGEEMNDSTWQAMMEEGRKMMEKFNSMSQEERDSVMKSMGMGGFGGPGMGGFGGPGEGGEGGEGGFGGPGMGGPGMGGFGGPGEGGEDGEEGGMGGPGMGGFGGPGMGGFGGGNTIQLSDSIRRLLFADKGGRDDFDGMGGPGGRRNLEGTAKAIKVQGKLTINGGDVHVETKTAGAEGLEGKRGITINGGKVYSKAKDDAVNSNGKIVFNGGDVFVWSLSNDAIDSNSRSNGAITISGGKVMSCSQCGPPDEAFDCDFSPMLLTGGIVFGMGGSMGGEATAPTEKENTQPTAVLSGLPCPKGKTLQCLDETGKEIFSFEIPFTMESSSSILSLPEFKVGSTYTVKIKDPDVVLKEVKFESKVQR